MNMEKLLLSYTAIQLFLSCYPPLLVSFSPKKIKKVNCDIMFLESKNTVRLVVQTSAHADQYPSSPGCPFLNLI